MPMTYHTTSTCDSCSPNHPMQLAFESDVFGLTYTQHHHTGTVC